MNVVMEQCEVGGKVGRVNGEVVEGEREVGRLQKERAECQVRCREFVAQIEVRFPLAVSLTEKSGLSSGVEESARG